VKGYALLSRAVESREPNNHRVGWPRTFGQDAPFNDELSAVVQLLNNFKHKGCDIRIDTRGRLYRDSSGAFYLIRRPVKKRAPLEEDSNDKAGYKMTTHSLKHHYYPKIPIPLALRDL
jgi:hypothetical protein